MKRKKIDLNLEKSENYSESLYISLYLKDFLINAVERRLNKKYKMENQINNFLFFFFVCVTLTKKRKVKTEKWNKNY